jgi:Putative F0F1-ATPase subunit Ca2+/Mg2+ transporter
MADDGPRDDLFAHGSDQSGELRGRDLIGLGGLLAGSVIVCTALGYLLDQAADSTPAFTLVGIALGMVAGAVGFWVRVRSTLRDPGSS